jgi:hypothetical protein
MLRWRRPHDPVLEEMFEARLRRLEDRAEIGELVVRYCVACDDRDIDQLVELFSPRATFRHGDGTVHVSGRDDISNFYRTRLRTNGITIHAVNGHVIEFTDPNIASGMVQGKVELGLQGKTVVGALRYVDRYVREGGRWLFEERNECIWYQVPADELVSALVRPLRRWWPGDAVVTVLPESLASWKRFYSAGADT